MSITLVWTLVLVISVIVEAITIDLVSIWFAVGALIALIGEFLGLSQTLQIIVLSLFPLYVFLFQDPWPKNI